MPQYELSVILKSLARPELHRALKGCLSSIWECGGIVRNVENLGEKTLPYKMKSHSELHTKGNYFIVDFDSSVDKVEEVLKEVRLRKDVVRPVIFTKEEEIMRPCELDMQCIFGETPIDTRNRKAWRAKNLKYVRRYEK